MSLRFSNGLLAILFIALLALLVGGPFWQVAGLPTGTPDEQMHTFRISAVERAFEQGVFWPRWFPTVYNGLGAPTFHHYSPALYWLAGAVHWLGFRLDQALKLVMIAALLLSGLSIYGWLRYAFSTTACLVGASLYLLHPHTLTRTFYFVGDYPQILALLLLPVCLWAVTALHWKAQARYWIAAVCSLAALVLAHNLTAAVGAGILAVYWLLLAIRYRRADGLLRCALAALAAVLLSAAFWLPAATDLALVQIENARQGFFHYSNHFLSWPDLFAFQSPVLDSRSGTPLKPPVTFGAATWLALAAAVISAPFVARRDARIWGISGALFALILLTLTQRSSALLWENIPALGFVQFPSRFLSIAPLGALPAAALAVDAWPSTRRWIPAVILLSAAALVLSPYLFPTHTPFTAPQQIESLTEEDILHSERTASAWGMSGSNEFLVREADMNVITGLSPEPAATTLTWRSAHEAVADLAGQEEPILLRLHYHPGWSAAERATLSAGPAGWTQLSGLRNPEQPLEIQWAGTVWQRRGEGLSLFGLFATLVGFLWLTFQQKRSDKQSGRSVSIGSASGTPRLSVQNVGALTACMLLLVVTRFAIDRSSRGPFILNSPAGELAFTVQGQPTVLGESGGSQVTFLGWELIQGATPTAGEPIIVRLYWQPHGQLHEQLSGFVHLYTPAIKQSWATANRGVGRPDSQWWNPEKYYIDELLLVVPADVPPITYSLVAGMVSSTGERLTVPGSEGEDLLYLRELAMETSRPGFLQKARPGVPTHADTAGGLYLQGFDLREEAGRHTLRLFWETRAGTENDWITYIHMVDAMGALVAQFDGPALSGLLPTSRWQKNALYIDRRQFELPAELSPGDYLFRIGLYDATTGTRTPFLPQDDFLAHFEEGQLLAPLAIPPSVSETDSCDLCSGDQ